MALLSGTEEAEKLVVHVGYLFLGSVHTESTSALNPGVRNTSVEIGQAAFFPRAVNLMREAHLATHYYLKYLHQPSNYANCRPDSVKMIPPKEGSYNLLWAAAGDKGGIINGELYEPVGVLSIPTSKPRAKKQLPG